MENLGPPEDARSMCCSLTRWFLCSSMVTQQFPPLLKKIYIIQGFTLQLPSSYFSSAFFAIEDAFFLKLRSVLRGPLQSFLTDNIFVLTNARPFNIRTKLTCMAHSSVPRLQKKKKALSCCELRGFISVTKDSEKKNSICRLDVVPYFKKDGCTKKEMQCCFAVCPFYFSSVKCYLVLFLYYPIDSPLFFLAFVLYKRGDFSVLPTMAAVMLCKSNVQTDACVHYVRLY